MAVKLVVDGKEVPINSFVQNILAGTITGAVATLHGVDKDWKKLQVEIER